MIHPPPEAFVRAAGRHRAIVESREASLAAQILGWAVAGLLTLGLHVGLYLALTRSITGYRALTGDAVALIMRHLSRDLDRREFGAYGPKGSIRLAAE